MEKQTLLIKPEGDLPTRIKLTRKAFDWPQERLSWEAGVSTKTVHRAETGKPVQPKLLAKILEALGVEA